MELRIAWNEDDSALRRDAETAWDALNVAFPREREDRLKELVAIAYDAGKPVGTCTARVIEYKVLRTRVFYLRANTPPVP